MLTTIARLGLGLLRWLGIGLITLLVVLSNAFLALQSYRPARTDHQESLFEGITYTRQARDLPRPLLIHIVSIDIHTPGVRFLVTPGDPSCGMEQCAATVAEFRDKTGVQVAINGSYFTPWRDNVPWDYYPHSGDPVDVLGLAIANGTQYSEDDPPMPKLCISQDIVQITEQPCPPGTQQAIAGSAILVANGRSTPQAAVDPGELHPRTALALSGDGAMLWIIVVDGRQRSYSEGVTLQELAQIGQELGAETVLNIDGGGSSTLVMEESSGSRTLNAPIHSRLPMRQRPVATQLGVYAEPLQ